MVDRNINIIEDLDGSKIVLINDIRFKGKREEWVKIEECLREYIGKYYIIEETSDKIYISKDFPDEFAHSESRIRLKGAVAKAKANASQAIPELVEIAVNKRYTQNHKEKHSTDAKYGWYRYHVRFAIPVYNDQTGRIARYNIYRAVMLVRHADDDKKYLYDFVELKKETSSPPGSENRTV